MVGDGRMAPTGIPLAICLAVPMWLLIIAAVWWVW
jgi:hypothetical protein